MSYTPAPGSNTWRTTFASAISNGVDSTYWDLIRTGAGQTVNQTGGNLVLTTGTTANAETIIRSKQVLQSYWLNLRYHMILSQRIANQNFFVELVDVVGDGLAYTINSATSVTVTIPSSTFTSANVGQGMFIGNLSSVGVPMRGTVASVSGSNVTFTVAGWPASGSGTCSLFGWNFQQVLYDGTTATNTKYDAGRKGYSSGYTTTNNATTASPGHMVSLIQDDQHSTMADGTIGSTTSYAFNQRASRWANIPTDEFPLYVQVRVLNGSTAPASSTTATLAFVHAEEQSLTPVQVEGGVQSAGANAIPVSVLGGSVIVSGSLTSAGTTTNTPATPSNYSVVTTASTNAASVKATAGVLLEMSVSNVTATPVFVKLYNKASAPTVGTDVPVLTLQVPANTTLIENFASKRFTTGIAIAATAAAAATDTGVAVAGVQIHGSYY